MIGPCRSTVQRFSVRGHQPFPYHHNAVHMVRHHHEPACQQAGSPMSTWGMRCGIASQHCCAMSPNAFVAITPFVTRPNRWRISSVHIVRKPACRQAGTRLRWRSHTRACGSNGGWVGRPWHPEYRGSSMETTPTFPETTVAKRPIRVRGSA